MSCVAVAAAVVVGAPSSGIMGSKSIPCSLPSVFLRVLACCCVVASVAVVVSVCERSGE